MVLTIERHVLIEGENQNLLSKCGANNPIASALPSRDKYIMKPSQFYIILAAVFIWKKKIII